MDSGFQGPEKPSRVASGLMEDGDIYDLDNEDEFLPPTATISGFGVDHVRQQFDQDIDEARKFSIQSLDEAERNRQRAQFVLARATEWDKTTWEGQNFLHYLAYDHNPKPSISLQWLMARAIVKLPHLMGRMDKANRTPLTTALYVGNERFSHAVCNNVGSKTRERIKPELLNECKPHDNDREITCLHTALTCDFSTEEQREKIVKSICSFVPEELFRITDHRGRTPLHLAVEYERCCKTQVGIVEELLVRGSQALDVDILTYNRTYSVYQYHESTRKTVQRRFDQAPARETRGDKLKLSDTKSDPKRAPSKLEIGAMGPSSLSGDKEGPASSLKRRDSITTTSRDRGGYKLQLDTQVVSSPLRGSPIDSAQNTIRAAALQKEEERAQAAKLISEQLKLLYLRTQRPDRASRCLRLQDEQDKELWFDFGPPKKLRKNEFQKQFGHLKLDSVLQYVAFPQIELIEGDDGPATRRKTRTDLIFFFNWLKQKGVKRIVKVIVDDLKTPSHSDEAIEEALESFNVEILDWRRLDLDPVSLTRVGMCLRELHLQWSGKNTTLRAWSEKEGLAMIPTLETISVTQVESSESDTRVNSNFNDFVKRVHESWRSDKQPIINGPIPAHNYLLGMGILTREGQLNQSQERGVDPHKWMQCMEHFNSHFRQIRALRDKITDASLTPVVVALIDDGTDIMHPDLKGMGFPGKSFHHYREGSTWRVSPYWDSPSGHGTLMARLIHRICPSAIIHVIKLQTFATEGSTKLQINPDSAIQAINYAAEQGAQIISMSWTIKPPTEPTKKADFDHAINNALNIKGLLMFCAASDQGKSADLMYPHGSNPNSFRIGAAKATGSMLDTVGDAHELSFIFPGHEVVIDHNYQDVQDKTFQKFEAHSGSSVATALATGLAALVMECVRLGIMHTNETNQSDHTVAITKDDLTKIRERQQMEHALTSIGTSHLTKNKYIEVWKTFSGAAEDLKNSEGDRIGQLGRIAGLARMFLRKGA
ncbi:intracellular serine protease [Trichoderma camerunense]